MCMENVDEVWSLVRPERDYANTLLLVSGFHLRGIFILRIINVDTREYCFVSANLESKRRRGGTPQKFLNFMYFFSKLDIFSTKNFNLAGHNVIFCLTKKLFFRDQAQFEKKSPRNSFCIQFEH